MVQELQAGSSCGAQGHCAVAAQSIGVVGLHHATTEGGGARVCAVAAQRQGAARRVHRQVAGAADLARQVGRQLVDRQRACRGEGVYRVTACTAGAGGDRSTGPRSTRAQITRHHNTRATAASNSHVSRASTSTGIGRTT